MPGSNAEFAHLDVLLFGVLPYVAMIVFFVMTVHRYRQRAFTFSSLSSQFLENDRHFWAMVPFHYGLLFVLLGHVVAFLFPSSILAWNGDPVRLVILEVTALVGGILALVGMVNLIVRRFCSARVRVVTSAADWVLYAMILAQIVLGVGIATMYTWGSSWFASTLSPYLWSLVKLNPDITFVTPLPLLVKLHIIGNFLLILLFPFTRLVHVLVVPNMYLWRKTQVVRWNYDRRSYRKAGVNTAASKDNR